MRKSEKEEKDRIYQERTLDCTLLWSFNEAAIR
jgi:hypothetical protein